jgi:hypothetical protein
LPSPHMIAGDRENSTACYGDILQIVWSNANIAAWILVWSNCSLLWTPWIFLPLQST